MDNGQIPLAITATAGTTDLGAIDPLPAIARLAQEYNTWLHVDAAYAGALLLSEYQHYLHGLALADSITVDFHKMFFQPISCGALLVKNKKHLSPLCFHADYLSREDDEETNLVDKSISTTRRFDALKLWMSLQTVDLDNFSKMISYLLELTQYAATVIESVPQLELLTQPNLTTVLFQVKVNHDQRPDNKTIDQFQPLLRRELLYSGQAVIAETKINGHTYLKLTLLNPCTNHRNIQQLIARIMNTAENLSLKSSAA